MEVKVVESCSTIHLMSGLFFVVQGTDPHSYNAYIAKYRNKCFPELCSIIISRLLSQCAVRRT